MGFRGLGFLWSVSKLLLSSTERRPHTSTFGPHICDRVPITPCFRTLGDFVLACSSLIVLHMSYSLCSLKCYIGEYYRVMNGDTRSLGHGSDVREVLASISGKTVKADRGGLLGGLGF